MVGGTDGRVTGGKDSWRGAAGCDVGEAWWEPARCGEPSSGLSLLEGGG